jgi:predicted secreted protein
MSNFLVYFLCWWVIFFIVQPIGIKEKSIETKKTIGTQIVKSRFLIKIIVATVLAGISGYFANVYIDNLLLEMVKAS